MIFMDGGEWDSGTWSVESGNLPDDLAGTG